MKPTQQALLDVPPAALYCARVNGSVLLAWPVEGGWEACVVRRIARSRYNVLSRATRATRSGAINLAMMEAVHGRTDK